MKHEKNLTSEKNSETKMSETSFPYQASFRKKKCFAGTTVGTQRQDSTEKKSPTSVSGAAYVFYSAMFIWISSSHPAVSFI